MSVKWSPSSRDGWRGCSSGAVAADSSTTAAGDWGRRTAAETCGKRAQALQIGKMQRPGELREPARVHFDPHPLVVELDLGCLAVRRAPHERIGNGSRGARRVFRRRAVRVERLANRSSRSAAVQASEGRAGRGSSPVVLWYKTPTTCRTAR